jgi:hypothetical protein
MKPAWTYGYTVSAATKTGVDQASSKDGGETIGADSY